MLSSRRQRSSDTCVEQEHLHLSRDKQAYCSSAKSWTENRRCDDDRQREEQVLDNDCAMNDNFDVDSDGSLSEEETTKTAATCSDVKRHNLVKGEQQNEHDVAAANKSDDSDFSDTLTKAKRARVETIVTNIKDNPTRFSFSFPIGNSSPPQEEFENDISDCEPRNILKSRKRRNSEEIRKLQQKADYLEQKDEYECGEEESLQSIATLHENAERCLPHKRSRSSSNATTSPQIAEKYSNRDALFKGAINVILPRNDNSEASSYTAVNAYDVLVQSLKQELTSVLSKVAEESAKRVLEELQYGVTSKETFLTRYPQFRDSSRNKRKEERKHVNNLAKYQNEQDLKYYKTQGNHRGEAPNYNVVAEAFQVRSDLKDSSNKLGGIRREKNPQINGKAESSQPHQIFSRFPFINLGTSGDDGIIMEKQPSPGISESPRNNADIRNNIQTEALSLVMPKSQANSPGSLSSTSSYDEQTITSNISKSKFSPHIQTPRREINLVRPSSRFSHSSITTRSHSPPRRNQSPNRSLFSMNKQPSFNHPLFSESPFYSPTSSAFRHPLRQNFLSSSSYRHPDAIMPQNLMNPPPLSFYPTANQTHPIYPFTSTQLPFPMLATGFQHGALANVLADTYGRFREGFSSTNGRPLSTRTSTRELKSMGLSKERDMIKTDSTEFRNQAVDVSPYSAASIQEGLTPQHLKKAKLMFFYTRYPSANTLKAYFSDVKFTRATTSQLIKWFSNFREFYYIQMEKFARLALSNGLADIGQLQVSRDSELFRVLSQHYNKSNDFRVPEKFIKVALKSLQEFFLAIKCGKDHDPAWKKVIYKVICKLDQEIPELFRSPSVLEHLNDI